MRIVELPLASSQSDIEFTITTGSIIYIRCDGISDCLDEAASARSLRFASQVQRTARMLDKGVRKLYPDLALRALTLPGGHFDVYVVDTDKPGSASSASGQIALNKELGVSLPDDGAVAFVIAREMGHVLARHHEENSSTSIAASVILNVTLPGSGFVKSALSAVAARVVARSKRSVQAIEADRIAISLLEASGYPLHNVSRSLLTASISLDDGTWSKRFRESADKLINEMPRAEIRTALVRDIESRASDEILLGRTATINAITPSVIAH